MFCVLSVCGAAWHAGKTPCVGSIRPRVCQQHAHMLFSMWTWCRYTRGRVEPTRGRFEPTHGEEGGGGSLLSLHPSLPLVPSLFLFLLLSLSSVVLFLLLSLFSGSLHSFSFSFSLLSFSATMTMITRPVGSLSVHTRL